MISPKVRQAFAEMDIDDRAPPHATRAWSGRSRSCTRAEAGDFSPPIHKEMGELITGIGSGLARLYSQEYQVLPYIYTHLVSLSCFTYLTLAAFLKGLHFEPGKSWTFGLMV